MLEDREISRIPCSVCGASSSGYHFGAITCEGCKLFFCRSMKRRNCDGKPNKQSYLHRCNSFLESSSSSGCITKCRRCRYDKCLSVGMSLSAICLGRHSAERRLQKQLTFSKLAKSNQLLEGHPSNIQIVSAPRSHQHPIATRSSMSVLPLISEYQTFSRDLEKLIQQTVETAKNLQEISAKPIPALPLDVAAEQTWRSMVTSDREGSTVNKCVRTLPSLEQMGDQTRLFNSPPYHPLFSLQLALKNMDAAKQHAPTIWPQVFPTTHFNDWGVASKLNQPELTLFPSLAHYNPNLQLPSVGTVPIQGNTLVVQPSTSSSIKCLPESKKTNPPQEQQFNGQAYDWPAVERYIRGNIPLQPASSSVDVFSVLLDYFKNPANLAQETLKIGNYPVMTQVTPITSTEMLAKLQVDNVMPSKSKTIMGSSSNINSTGTSQM